MLAEPTIQALAQYEEFYERAAAFVGRPRERMLALWEADELFFRLHPYHYRALQIVRVASQLGKPGARRPDGARGCESRIIAVLTGVIQDATCRGDLVLHGPQRPEELAFTVWALVFGTRALMSTAIATRQLGILDGFDTATTAGTLMFDALGWSPLSSEWDYEVTRRRVRAEVFATEWAQTSAA